MKFIAGWSSSVARRAHNPKVVGSNPSPATMVPWCSGYHVCLSRRRSRVQVPSEPPFIFGFIAQSVEQRTENPRVAGSIPAGATSEYAIPYFIRVFLCLNIFTPYLPPLIFSKFNFFIVSFLEKYANMFSHLFQ